MPSLSEAASLGGSAEFLAEYDPSQAVGWVSGTGQTLLHLAVGNPDPEARVAIATRLLDDGADATALLAPQGYTALHILFGAAEHDVVAEAPLVERLLDAGLDVNAVAARSGTALQTLASQLKFSDETLAPFYDVLFARPDLDLLVPGKMGRSSLESARRLVEKRGALVARMEEYLSRRGERTGER